MKRHSTVLFLRGVPGSGKSTLAKDLEKLGLFTRITADEVGLNAWKQPLIEAIERKDPYIIVDRCHTSKKQRENALNVVEPYKTRVYKILVTLSKSDYDTLERRIKNDTGHAYGVDERIVALKNHISLIRKDRVDFKKEGFDQHIFLEVNKAAYLIREVIS